MRGWRLTSPTVVVVAARASTLRGLDSRFVVVVVLLDADTNLALTSLASNSMHSSSTVTSPAVAAFVTTRAGVAPKRLKTFRDVFFVSDVCTVTRRFVFACVSTTPSG